MMLGGERKFGGGDGGAVGFDRCQVLAALMEPIPLAKAA
jgi:hypothetical protein